ncbi:MAG TPA: DUF3043 domain-containing protein [Jatrophihabitantaceae bacterium]
MKLLPRRPDQPAAADVPTEAPSALSGKGRPTPKRREAAPTRGPVTAPKTRKEAYARQKQQTRQTRTARRTPSESLSPQQRRALLRSGDESVLPRRDQGQTRKLARDWVDSHRMASNYLLLLFPLMILSYVLPYAQFLVLGAFALLILEWNITGRRIRKLAIERFGKADGGPMTIGFYAGSRAYLPRRWRLPSPQVQRGDQI